MSKIIIYTDGGSRGNPGPSAIGVVICDEKETTLKKYGESIGVATNNEAEYEAVIFALKKAKLLFGKKKTKDMSVVVRVDSELLERQLNHKYKLKEPRIQKLFIKIWNLMLDFNKVSFEHVLREKNKEADALANDALDKDSAVQNLPL
jgi:ribonuclease HI